MSYSWTVTWIITYIALFWPADCQTGPQWDALRVTWGPKLEAPFFDSMPRTTKDALAQGFQKVNDCSRTAKWRGARYVKGGDYSVALLYDKGNHLAGIQTAVPTGQPNGFPPAELRPPFLLDGPRWVSTVYFVDPATICTKGRSSAEVRVQGLGTNLYVQNSTVPERSFIVPEQEVDIRGTSWTEGMCYKNRMGQHYSYNTTSDMRCENLFPMFVIYNGGRLTSFGWAIQTNLPSSRFEHPPQAAYGMFMKAVPQCLYSRGTISILHVFMKDNVTATC